ncbi:TRAP transporter substrate-binding protein DctP [Chloroflexota bacterium]
MRPRLLDELGLVAAIEWLVKGMDMWEATKAGTTDIAWCFHGFWGGMTTLADVLTLPFVPYKSAEQSSGIFWNLMEDYPSMAKQFEDNKILIGWTFSPYFPITTDKQIKTQEDFEGLKFRAPGGPSTEMIQLMGASPTSVPFPASYENLQKGVLDGVGIPWEAGLTYKFWEVTKYWTMAPMFVGYFTMAINWDTWDSLPSDVQEQIMSVSGLEGSKTYGKNMFDACEVACRDAMKEAGSDVVFYDVPEAELAKWQDIAGKPLWDKWVKDREAEGYSETQEILDKMVEMVK